MFPIVMNINTLDGSFIGILQRLRSTEEYMFVSSKTFTVTAASEGSLSLLEVRRQ